MQEYIIEHNNRTTKMVAPTPMEALLGQKLLTKKSGPGKTATLLKGKELVLLYFSASWCPPCKAFTPVLADFYAQFAATGSLEIVYVSSDRTAAEFTDYYAKMPWLALPNDEAAAASKANLATALGIRGLPTLVVLRADTGLFVTADARAHVASAAGSALASEAAIAAWKATPPISLEQAAAEAAGGSGLLSLLQRGVMAILKNPMYIFGTLCLIKWIMRKVVAYQSGDSDVPPATIEAYNEPIPDDEF